MLCDYIGLNYTLINNATIKCVFKNYSLKYISQSIISAYDHIPTAIDSFGQIASRKCVMMYIPLVLVGDGASLGKAKRKKLFGQLHGQRSVIIIVTDIYLTTGVFLVKL